MCSFLTLLQVKRTHFHDFMIDVHTKLRDFKDDRDPLLRVADAFAKVRLGLQRLPDLQLSTVCMSREEKRLEKSMQDVRSDGPLLAPKSRSQEAHLPVQM